MYSNVIACANCGNCALNVRRDFVGDDRTMCYITTSAAPFSTWQPWQHPAGQEPPACYAFPLLSAHPELCKFQGRPSSRRSRRPPTSRRVPPMQRARRRAQVVRPFPASRRAIQRALTALKVKRAARRQPRRACRTAYAGWRLHSHGLGAGGAGRHERGARRGAAGAASGRQGPARGLLHCQRQRAGQGHQRPTDCCRTAWRQARALLLPAPAPQTQGLSDPLSRAPRAARPHFQPHTPAAHPSQCM